VPLETATYSNDLVITNPAGSDSMNAGDDHIRLVKSVLKNTFPGLNAAASRVIGGSFGHLSGDGSSSAPAYSFNAEATLGFYRSASGTISVAGGRLDGMCPPGAVLDFAMATVPAGWLECNGQAVSRTTYAALFSAIGTTWGSGDGSTTFNVPPASDRYRRGRNNAGLAGAVGTLQNPANLAHTHTLSVTSGGNSVDHSHTYSGNTGGASAGHTHGFSWSGTTSGMNANNPHNHSQSNNARAVAGDLNNNGGGGGAFSAMSSSAATININSTDINHGHDYSGSGTTGGNSNDHTHGFSGTTSGASASHTHSVSGTTSGGSADNGSEARPYSLTVLTCIKT